MSKSRSFPSGQISRSEFIRKFGFATVGLTAVPLSASAATTAPASNAVDVRSYGAKGDGITDDTAAFQVALASGSHLFIPPNFTFLVNELSLNGHQLFGGGKIRKSTGNFAIQMLGDGCVIDGLVFLGGGTRIQASGQACNDIKLGDGARNCIIRDCHFDGGLYSAISVDINTESDATLLYKTAVNGVIISGNVFRGRYTRPLLLQSVENLTIQGNIFRNCTHDAIRLRQKDGYCIIDSNQFIDIGTRIEGDSTTRDAIDTHWSGQNLIISNNIVRGDCQCGI